jgi:MFS family permease
MIMSLNSNRLKRNAWRRLLQLDQPAPVRTETEVTAEAERNYPWNFTVNLLDGVTFWFGLNMVSGSTIIPLFISKLTDNTLIIGLIAVVAQASWYLPQILTASFIEKLARKKPVVVNLGFFTERLPVWLWPAACLLIPFSPGLALFIFFLGYAWHGIGAGAIAPAWQDLIARCFPTNRRGRFFGITTFIGTGVGAIGALFSSWLLEVYAFPLNFTFIFLVGAAAITISWGFIALTREPVQPPTGPALSPIWSRLRQIIRQDHNFRRFLLARFLLALGTMGLAFVTVAAVQRLNVPDGTVGFYTVALLIGQTIGSLLAGWFADHFGHKLSLEAAGGVAFAAFGLAWLAPAEQWYYLIFIFLGMALGSTVVSGLMITLEFSSPEQRPTYIGIANTVVGIGSSIAPLMGGWLAGLNYAWLFGLSAVLNVGALVAMRWFVIDPRWQVAGGVTADVSDDGVAAN